MKQLDLNGKEIFYKKINRKSCCLNCLAALPNNHWSFCSKFCKEQYKQNKQLK